MRTVKVEENKVVVTVDGARVRYGLPIIEKRIKDLKAEVAVWVEYKRLLTQRALDEATCTAKYHSALAEKGDTRCGVCGQPLRQ
jgi:hypothetical protein